MSQNPAMQVPTTIEQFQQTAIHFFEEQSIEQINSDLISIMMLITHKMKSPDLAQLERERFFSYLLFLQSIHTFLNDINDISKKLSFPT